MYSRLFRLIAIALSVVVHWVGMSGSTIAGIGGEHVVVVVNAKSKASRTIANHYVALRDVPESNVVFLPDVPDGLRTSLVDFKTRILRPILAELDSRKIGSQVRVIAYSADFPTSVDISADTQRLTDPMLKQYQLPTASISGLTSLYQFVLADSPKYLDLGANLYARGPMERHFVNPFADKERRLRYEDAARRFDQKSYAVAASEFESLFEDTPTQSPIAIRSAEAYSAAGDEENAKRMLRRAIKSGWKSATYLNENEWLFSIASDDEFKVLISSLSTAPTVAQSPVAFASDVSWMVNGHPSAKSADGIRYLLSCMLAVVHPRGSTVEQAVEVLQRSAIGDGTFPEAAFWFTNTPDVRSKTRYPAVADALLWMAHLGRQTAVIGENLPSTTGDCVGLMMGTASFQIIGKRFQFVPGSICDNLTSLGAAFDTPSQTKLTDLLHEGAAISSGAVAEPFSLPPKFPTPMMYGYYASGATAIEAFYLSVTSPYQLLIVGDPLANAFSRAPQDRISVSVFDELSGQKRLRLRRRTSKHESEHPASEAIAIDLFIEGKLIRRLAPLPLLTMNLEGAPAGVVEIRTSVMGADPVLPVRSRSTWLTLANEIDPPVVTQSDDGVSVNVSAAQSDKLELTIHGEVVATFKGKRGTFQPNREELGDGPLPIRPVAIIGDKRVPGRPLVLNPH